MTPYKTLQSRSFRRCPLRSDAMTDILQSVRSHGKVDFPVDVLIHIDQTLGDVLGISCVSFRQCRYRSGFITAVMINWCIGILLDLVYELLPHVVFVLVGIRPERIVLRGISLTH